MANLENIISLEILDGLKMKMKEMAPQQRKIFSRREAVLYLVDSIQDLLMKNYSLSEISAILQKEGVDISAATLKTYLRETGKTKNKIKKQRAPRTVTRSANDANQPSNGNTNDVNQLCDDEQKTKKITTPDQTINGETTRKMGGNVGFEIEEDSDVL